MDLKQCWSVCTKAEQLLKQGHWPQAHYLFEDVLHHLPNHIHQSAQDPHTKPCQLVCLICGLRDAAVNQSEILNNMGQHQRAFDVLNNAYALLQFLSIESSELIFTISNVLEKHSNDLLEHLNAFCLAQRSANWQLEYQHIEKAHHYFTQLKRAYGIPLSQPLLN